MKTRRIIERARERSRKWNKIRWGADRARRDAEEPARLREMELARILGEGPSEPGQYVGTLQWSDRTGKVRRWTIRRGPRAGQILIDGLSSARTVTWLLDRLRRHLSPFFRWH